MKNRKKGLFFKFNSLEVYITHSNTAALSLLYNKTMFACLFVCVYVCGLSPPERLDRLLAPSWANLGYRPKKFRIRDPVFPEIRKNPEQVMRRRSYLEPMHIVPTHFVYFYCYLLAAYCKYKQLLYRLLLSKKTNILKIELCLLGSDQ